MKFKFFKKKRQFKVKRITYMSRANLKPQPRESCLIKSFYSFANVTKINGLYYLRRSTNSNDGGHFSRRYFWIVIPLLLLALAGVLIHLIATNFFQNPILISHAAPTSLQSIPFPAITICPFDQVSPMKVQLFLNKSIIPTDVAEERIEFALGTLNGFTQGYINGDLEDVDIADRLLLKNNLTISTAMHEIGLKCDEYIKRFTFDRETYECAPNNCSAWRVVSTIHGICCSFNFHPEDMRKALYSNEWGKRSGVSILINSQLVTRSGFNVFIHQSADYITKATPIFSLIPRYEHFVRIYPRCNKPDKQFLRLPYESRHCLLPNDKDLALFRQSRCRLLELTKTIHQECGCHPYFMPILEKTEIRNCTARDIGCFKYDSAIWNPLSSDCMPSCFDVTYRVGNSATNLRNSTAIMPLYKNFSQISRPYVVHIFYGEHSAKVFKKILVITWIDLIANLGGILNLTLGISVISIVEIAYYFVYKFVKKLQKRGNRWNF